MAAMMTMQKFDVAAPGRLRRLSRAGEVLAHGRLQRGLKSKRSVV